MADVLLSDSRMRDLQLNNDTMSDYSDTATQDSHDGDKERDPEMMEERFRVDRKKLEQMLQAAAEGKGQSAEDFFQKIMDTTNTTITWPSKLKIGAKSKKDPHIKVCGKILGVQEAKEKVMAVLDSKSNRVTLKMDVSHTDHSHVIGKGGNNIKKVMLETGCHIHFPDSNRNNLGEKSNQVSIAGQPDGVEKARQQIRELLPLVFTFDFQSPAIRPLDMNTPLMQQIQQLYNITVSFKQKSQSSSATVIVRGSQNCSRTVLKGVNYLMDHLLTGMRVPVVMTLEIAPQHHAFMVGRQGSNIKQIMSQTGAIIQFPDGNSPNERRSTVTIQGHVESVYLARQQILGCLPLVLMFDMKEELEVESGQLSKLMEQLDLFISIKPKPKQPSKSVIVKSIEKNSENMYIARKRLLDEKYETPFISTSIPSIHSPYLDIKTNNSLGLSMIGQNILNINTSVMTLRPNNQMSPLSSPTSSPASPTCWNSNHYLSYYPYNYYSRVANLTPMHQSQFDYYAHYNKLLPEPSTPNYYVRVPTPSERAPSSSNTSNMSSPVNSPRNGSPIERVNCVVSPPLHPCESNSPQLVNELNLGSYYVTPETNEVRSTLDSNNLTSLTAQLQALNTGDNDMHVMNPNDSYLDVSRKSSPSNSGNISDLRKILNSSNGQTMLKNSALLDEALNVHFQSETTCSNNSDDSSKMVQGCEWKELLSQHLSQQQQQQLSLDYEYKKLMATKAMQKKPVRSESRTPTEVWAGLGFSKSMPDSMIREKLRLNLPIDDSTYESFNGDVDKDPWKESRSNHISAAPGDYPSVRRRRNEYNLSHSSHIDSVSLPKNSWSNKTDLPLLFNKLGLGKYTDLFQQQEIDMATFLTLTDQDLKELGISTFGARRKMLLAISDLTKRRQFSPTPGSNNPFRMSGASSSSSSNLSNGIATSSACW